MYFLVSPCSLRINRLTGKPLIQIIKFIIHSILYYNALEIATEIQENPGGILEYLPDFIEKQYI